LALTAKETLNMVMLTLIVYWTKYDSMTVLQQTVCVFQQK